nr:hypothetical protein [Tanacetum cinerariifolium]
MSTMQLNSKFVNKMLPKWGRFMTAVKLNRGLRDSNYDQLYAYLKQQESYANENKMMLDQFSQHIVDPLALMSNVSHQQHYLQSSSTPPSTYVSPHLADNTHRNSGISLTDNLIENLTNTLALLTQSYGIRASILGYILLLNVLGCVLPVLFLVAFCCYTMADVNVNTPADQAPTIAPPTRTNDQILPHIRWVPIGKSNSYLDVEKLQSNPIYKIASVGCYKCQLDKKWFDLTKDTLRDALQITPVNNNKAFSSPPSSDALIKFVNKLDTMADVNVNTPADQAPTIAPPTRTNDQILPHIRWVPIGKSNSYLDVEKLQSNPIYKIASVGCYKCQLDKKWFDLTKDTLRDALQITPVNNNKAFSSPPSSDALIKFVNKLGYSKLVRNLSNVVTNDMFQLWRALTTIINLCLTGKTLGFERPRASVLQILWGAVNRAHLNYAERIWEEFPNPSIPSLKTKIIWHNILMERRKEYLAKVAKHQRYLPSEQGSDPDSPIPKPTKATKKSKPSAPKADLRPPEPRVDDEEADVQRAFEESLKSIYDAPRGPLPLVVIREPKFGKYKPLPQTPKKKSPADQYIFQKRTSTPTGSSGHDESSSLYNELGLADSEVESNEDVLGIDAGVQGEGQAGPNPSDTAASQPLPSPFVHARPNLKHMDLEIADVSTQPYPEQMDEGFTATAYPKVQENLKLTVEEQVILEEPASSSGTLSSLQHLTKNLSFSDLFFNDKPSEANNEKTIAETKAKSMVSITIQQDTSSILPMTTPVIDLTSRPESPNVHQPLKATATETTTTTTTIIHPPPPQP